MYGDVDFSVGNINFIGNVVVRGNILPGFKVRAEGDIRVWGGIEGAEVEAGGNIEVSGGVLAHGNVKAGVDFKASFIQNSEVMALQDVIVSQTIMHSKVSAGRNVECKATKGFIVGGMIQAGEKVVARTIGNLANTPTVIEVGAKPELRLELSEIKKDLKIQRENIIKSEQALHYFDQLLSLKGNLPADKKAMQIKLINAKMMAEKIVRQHQERVAELEAILEGDTKARVEVLAIIYSGVKLVFGKSVRFIKEKHSRCYFSLDEEKEIRVNPLS